MRTAEVRTRTNIALVKYWGKRDVALNLPATSSVSMTLSDRHTTTRVTFLEGQDAAAGRGDELTLDGRPAGARELARASRFLDRVRTRAGIVAPAVVESSNNFPTAAGLASSASGFAALAVAATRAAGLELAHDELAELARLGSGSAPRSLLGGFVDLSAGEAADGSDCRIRQVADEDHWDVRLVVGVTTAAAKKVGSTEGMNRTRDTSPYWDAWLTANAVHRQTALRAIAERDLSTLGTTVEASCYQMHALALGSTPPLLYWNGATVEAMRAVWQLREEGAPGWVTIDAGPHVKVLCAAADAGRVADTLHAVPGVIDVYVERPGPGPELLGGQS